MKRFLHLCNANCEFSRILHYRFPRNRENFNSWFMVMGHCVKVRLVIYLDCPVEKMEERILKRGKASERVDDNPESLRKRFDTHRQVHNILQTMHPPLTLLQCVKSSFSM